MWTLLNLKFPIKNLKLTKFVNKVILPITNQSIEILLDFIV